MDWPLVKLGDCVDLIAGFPFKSERFLDEAASGVPLVKGENVSQGHILWSISKYWPQSEYSDYSRVHLQPGDVVLAMDRPWVPAGLKWAVIRPGDPRALLVQRCARLRAKVPGLDQRFLCFVIGAASFEDYIRPITTGVNVPHISGGQILSFTFQLPPIPIQHRIVDILSPYDDLIENCGRRIRVLDEMSRALYREWFVNFRYPGHEKVPFVDSALGRIPQGWDVKPLGEIASLTMGLSPKGNTYNEKGDGTPLVNGPVEFGGRLTKRVKWTTSPTRLCADGDLVVCVRGSTTGKVVKSDGVYCLGRGVCALSSKQQSFIDQHFQNELPRLLGQTSGSTFPSWTGPQLQAHPLMSPPSEQVAQFERLVQPMTTNLQYLFREIENLKKTRDLLLPRLLSGQLSVDADLESAA